MRILGNTVYRLDDYVGARGFQEQALGIYRDIGDRQGESHALSNLGVFAEDLGNYVQAQVSYEQALSIWREIGFRQGESVILTNLGYICHHEGMYAEAKVFYEQAWQTSREIGFRMGEGWGPVTLALLSHHQGDNETALVYSRQALRIAEEIGDRENQGFALVHLGHSQAGLGRWAEAGDAYRRALTLRQELGQHNLALETQAGLARVSLTQGDLLQARKHVQPILEHLETGWLDGTDEPFRVYLTCYQVLLASNDSRATELLCTAYRLLQGQAEKIQDEALRRSFLGNVAAHHEIVETYRDLCAVQPQRQFYPEQPEDHSQTIIVRLPSAKAARGRPLREGGYVPVTWMVAAPADDAIASKVARRRHRLLRLVREAAAQGAVPRVADLAAALEASRGTIKRDLAALRRDGHPVQTRGTRGG